MFKPFGKKIVQNHKTGRVTGSNTKVKLETNRDRKGLGNLTNGILDVLEAFTQTSVNESRSTEVVSAYIEKDMGDYHVLVTFADGKSETKTFRFGSDAQRLMKEIYNCAGTLSMIRGSYLGSEDTILLDTSKATKVQRNGNTLRICFDNNCAISVKYSSQYRAKDDFQQLANIISPPIFRSSFGSSFKRVDTGSRINKVLGNW